MLECVTKINYSVIEECIKPLYSKAYKRMLAAVTVYLILCTLLLLNTIINSGTATRVFCITAIVSGGLVLWIILRNKYQKSYRSAVDTLFERLKVVKKTESSEGSVSFGEDSFTVSDSTDEPKSYSLSDLESWHETENFITVCLKGKLMLFVEKSSIRGGTAEDLKKRLSSFTNSR